MKGKKKRKGGFKKSGTMKLCLRGIVADRRGYSFGDGLNGSEIVLESKIING